MHLNSLHVAEVLSDDSNFRKRAMDKLAGPLAHVLLQTPQNFAAAWLAGGYLGVSQITPVPNGPKMIAVPPNGPPNDCCSPKSTTDEPK